MKIELGAMIPISPPYIILCIVDLMLFPRDLRSNIWYLSLSLQSNTVFLIILFLTLFTFTNCSLI